MLNKIIPDKTVVYLFGEDCILCGLSTFVGKNDVEEEMYIVAIGDNDYRKLRSNLYLTLEDAILAWMEKTRLSGGIYRSVEEVRIGDTIYSPMLNYTEDGSKSWEIETFTVETIFLYKDSFGDTNIRMQLGDEGYFYDEPEYVMRAECFTTREACAQRCVEKDDE